MAGKHMAPWPRCATCGRPENAHPFRHPFKTREWPNGTRT